MSACNNCKKSLGCSCQVRVATNGMRCCAACISDYENKIRQEKQNKQNINPPITP